MRGEILGNEYFFNVYINETIKNWQSVAPWGITINKGSFLSTTSLFANGLILITPNEGTLHIYTFSIQIKF